jgi:hypothetical protein
MDRLRGGSVVESRVFHDGIASVANLSDGERRSLDTYADRGRIDTSRFLYAPKQVSDALDDKWKQATSALEQLVRKQPAFLESLKKYCDQQEMMQSDRFRQLPEAYDIDRETIDTAVDMYCIQNHRIDCKDLFEMAHSTRPTHDGRGAAIKPN